jgi:hypothetical protein
MALQPQPRAAPPAARAYAAAARTQLARGGLRALRASVQRRGTRRARSPRSCCFNAAAPQRAAAPSRLTRAPPGWDLQAESSGGAADDPPRGTTAAECAEAAEASSAAVHEQEELVSSAILRSVLHTALLRDPTLLAPPHAHAHAAPQGAEHAAGAAPAAWIDSAAAALAPREAPPSAVEAYMAARLASLEAQTAHARLLAWQAHECCASLQEQQAALASHVMARLQAGRAGADAPPEQELPAAKAARLASDGAATAGGERGQQRRRRRRVAAVACLRARAAEHGSS